MQVAQENEKQKNNDERCYITFQGWKIMYAKIFTPCTSTFSNAGWWMCFVYLIKIDTQCHVIRTANNTQLYSHIINVSLFYMNKFTASLFTVDFPMHCTYHTRYALQFRTLSTRTEAIDKCLITIYIRKSPEMPAFQAFQYGWSWLSDISFCQLTRTQLAPHQFTTIILRHVLCSIQNSLWQLNGEVACVCVCSAVKICWVHVNCELQIY